MDALDFDDLAPGAVFGSGHLLVTAEDVCDFAAQWDPQPVHTDADAAVDGVYGELVASPWHVAAMTMRLLVTGAFRPRGGLVEWRVEALDWHRPVRPGDVLSVRTTVLEARPGAPGQGRCRIRVETLDVDSRPVQTLTAALILPRRA